MTDFIIPSQPFINPASVLARQWEALNFVTDKIVTTAYSGELGNARSAVPVGSVPATTLQRQAARSAIITHLCQFFAASAETGANAAANLPADPGVRQYYLSILHTFLIACAEEDVAKFALQLLMMVRFFKFGSI